MSKVSKLFKALSLILKQPSLLNKVLDDDDVNKNEVVKKYNLEKGLKTVDITELLPNFDVTIEPYAALILSMAVFKAINNAGSSDGFINKPKLSVICSCIPPAVEDTIGIPLANASTITQGKFS